jgi:kinesin family protein 2/24
LKAILSAQLSEAEAVLAAACSKETAKAVDEAVAFERSQVKSSVQESDIEQLEQELHQLHEENRELRLALQELQGQNSISAFCGSNASGSVAPTIGNTIGASISSGRFSGGDGHTSLRTTDVGRSVSGGDGHLLRGECEASQFAFAPELRVTPGSSATTDAPRINDRRAATKQKATPNGDGSQSHSKQVKNQVKGPAASVPTTGMLARRNSAVTASEASRRSATPTMRRSATHRTSPRDDSSLGLASQKGGQKTRMNFDKRTLRRMHREGFVDSIREWTTSHVPPKASVASNPACQVYVRLRPIFGKEKQKGEFEAVSIFEESGEVVIHNCLLQADLVQMYVHHMGFSFPRVFGPSSENELIYEECGAPLVSHALSGQLATLFMFGQTGSGKTFTMEAIIARAVKDLAVVFDGNTSSVPLKLRVFEIAGKKCMDLLSRTKAELKILDDEGGRTQVVGAIEALPKSADEILSNLRDAFASRATASHGRNDDSSRSHWICMVELPSQGSLVLVDCAGTERRQDSDQHSSERTRESAEINTSLHALKECIRYRTIELRQARDRCGDNNFSTPRNSLISTPSVRVPYRGSQLTRVLHESFTRRGSKLAAVGTLSPASLDTEHSLSTLRTLQLLMNSAESSDAPCFEERVDIDPRALLQNAKRACVTGNGSKPTTPVATTKFAAPPGPAVSSTNGRPHRQTSSPDAHVTANPASVQQVPSLPQATGAVGIGIAGPGLADSMYSEDDLEQSSYGSDSDHYHDEAMFLK